MMSSSKRQTALDKFLEAYQPLGEQLARKIWKRVHAAGFSPDDPAAFLPAVEAILEHRQASFLKAHREVSMETTQAIRAEGDAIRRTGWERTSEILLEQALDAAIPRLVRAIHWNAAAQLAAVLGLSILLAGAAGYWACLSGFGRNEGVFADVVDRPDAASWRILMAQVGNLDQWISENCRTDIPDTWAGGEVICTLPVKVWIDPPPGR